MKLAFSTLGCPQWQLVEIADAARRFGFAGVELRCLAGELDLLRRPELRPPRVEETRYVFAERGLTVCCVDTSCCFDAVDAATRARNVDAAIRHARLAAGLGSPLIRVFPNEVPEGATRAETRARIAGSLGEVAARVPLGVRVALETHGAFDTGEAVAEIVRRANHPSIGVVWDVANTIAAGETLARSVDALAPHLVHVHLRDARPVPGRRFWQPVLGGRGDVPIHDAIAKLHALGYREYVSFEWEKHWRPEIEDPEIAFPDFRDAMRAQLPG